MVTTLVTQVVKKTHETGGFGSIGYGCVFKKEEAMKNLLRTHTTAISAQMLHKLANQEGGFKPKKYFSIDRVFRNEAMDATHLCEFHQVQSTKSVTHLFARIPRPSVCRISHQTLYRFFYSTINLLIFSAAYAALSHSNRNV